MKKNTSKNGNANQRLQNSNQSSADRNREEFAKIPKESFVEFGEDNVYIGQLSLPYVPRYYRNVLDLIGLPYRKSLRDGEVVYEYWDPNCEEYEEKTLPQYFRSSKGMYLTAKNVKGKVPAVWMWNDAFRMEAFVQQTLKNYKRFSFARKVLKDQPCATAVTKRIIHDQEIAWKENRIRVFSLDLNNLEKIVIFFDLNRIDEIRDSLNGHGAPRLELKVPKYMEQYVGKIIGKNGAVIEYMAKQMHLNRITVTKMPDEEALLEISK